MITPAVALWLQPGQPSVSHHTRPLSLRIARTRIRTQLNHDDDATSWHNPAMAKASKPARRPLTFAQHLQTIRAQFPHIKPFAEEDDLYWSDEGMEALQAGSLVRAEQIFKKLLVAQPNHFDGYYGLSLVYKQQRQFSRAILFADEAIRLAQAFIDDGSLDPVTFEELRSHRASLIPSSPPHS